MVTALLFTSLVAAVVVQRIFELRLSRKNERALLAQGATEHAAGHFRLMQLLHTGWFGSMLLEVWLLGPSTNVAMACGAGTAFVAGQLLRYAAIRTLGQRWSVRILTLPDAAPVQGGIYRYVRHPNYLGVMLEIAALPMMHNAVWTAVIFSALNLALLMYRIRKEEQALDEGGRYSDFFGNVPRLLPQRVRHNDVTDEA